MTPGKTQLLQEQRLKEKAECTGNFAGLSAFYASLKDADKLSLLAKRVPESDIMGSAYIRMFSAVNTGDMPAMETVAGLDDYWCHYTYIKVLLGRGLIKEAVSAAGEFIEKKPSSAALLNNIARYLAGSGKTAAAMEVAQAGLSICPAQADMARFVASLKAGNEMARKLYLGAAPKLHGLDYYIYVHDGEKHIRTAIEGVLSQDYPVSSVILVNCGPKNVPLEITGQYPVYIVEKGPAAGISAARNAAFRASTANFLGTIDMDASPARDFSRIMMAEFENCPAETAGLGGAMGEFSEKTDADKWRAAHMAGHSGNYRIYNPDFISGSCCIYERSAVLKSGGFNEKYGTHHEDADICRRLKESGYAIAYIPQAGAVHYRTDDEESLLRHGWDRNFLSCEEKGSYSNLKSLAGNIIHQASVCVAYVNEDVGNRAYSLLFLDVMNFIYGALADISYAEKKGLLRKRSADAVRRGFSRELARLDAKYGGNVRERAAGILGESIAHGNETGGLPEELEPAMKAAAGLLGSIETNLYSHLCSIPYADTEAVL